MRLLLKPVELLSNQGAYSRVVLDQLDICSGVSGTVCGEHRSQNAEVFTRTQLKRQATAELAHAFQ